MTKWVYTFGDGNAEGNAKMKDSLGGKGANLAEMSNLGLSVPPGGTVRAISFVMQEYMSNLRETGSTANWKNRMFDFTEFNSLIGTPEMLSLGEQYADQSDNNID